MTTWEEIRDEVAGMLADGQPLEDVISKLDEMKNPKPMTNEEWLKKANTEQLADWLARITNAGYLLALRMKYHCDDVDAVREWLKEKHD